MAEFHQEISKVRQDVKSLATNVCSRQDQVDEQLKLLTAKVDSLIDSLGRQGNSSKNYDAACYVGVTATLTNLLLRGLGKSCLNGCSVAELDCDKHAKLTNEPAPNCGHCSSSSSTETASSAGGESNSSSSSNDASTQTSDKQLSRITSHLPQYRKVPNTNPAVLYTDEHIYGKKVAPDGSTFDLLTVAYQNKLTREQIQSYEASRIAFDEKFLFLQQQCGDPVPPMRLFLDEDEIEALPKNSPSAGTRRSNGSVKGSRKRRSSLEIEKSIIVDKRSCLRSRHKSGKA